MHRAPRPADSEPLRLVTVAAEIPADVKALYVALLERPPPAERAELARLLLENKAAYPRLRSHSGRSDLSPASTVSLYLGLHHDETL